MAAPHRLTALLVLVLCLPGCARWRSETQPVPELLLRDHPSEIRVTRNDSSRIVLHDPALVGDSLAGFPKRPPKVTTPLPEARAGEEPRVMVPLSEVRRVETKHTDTAQTLLLFGGVAAILALAALIAVGISLRGGLL